MSKTRENPPASLKTSKSIVTSLVSTFYEVRQLLKWQSFSERSVSSLSLCKNAPTIRVTPTQSRRPPDNRVDPRSRGAESVLE